MCTADFLTFQMLLIIGTDSFFVSNCKLVWENQGIYSLWKVSTLNLTEFAGQINYGTLLTACLRFFVIIITLTPAYCL
jgi:hypothetical protein